MILWLIPLTVRVRGPAVGTFYIPAIIEILLPSSVLSFLTHVS